MAKSLTVSLVALIFMAVVSCGKTPHDTIIGKYEFDKVQTSKLPEYNYIPLTDTFKKDMDLIIDSELEITEDSISWKVYDEKILDGKYTLKYETKEKGEVDLILKNDPHESIISIEILDDKYIKFRQGKGAPPMAFKKVTKFSVSPEKAKRKIENEINLANEAAKSDLHNMYISIQAYLIDHNVSSIDLMAIKKESGLVLSEGVSIEILNNQIDSFTLVSSHKSGDSEYISDSSGEITQQKKLSENEILSIVKNGAFIKYPGITLNQAVNDFLGSPSWEVIRANNGRYYVNVAGEFVFNKKPAKAILQLMVDTTDETFTINVLEINGESQNHLERNQFLDAMFSGN